MQQTVTIHIESEIDGTPVKQRVTAIMVEKGNAVYYRYKESDEQLGNTTTLLKVQPGRIKMNRHGDVEAEQIFEVARELPGFFHFPQGRLKLKTETDSLHQSLQQGIGTLSWSYRCWSDEQLLGKFKLRLTIQEEC